MKKILISTTFLLSTLNASNLSHSLSNQGFTGVINTPNAQVMNQGDLTIHFDNQFDNVLRGYNYHKHYSYQNDYIFGAGMFPYFEIQGRLSEAPSYHRDLSANFKFQLPYKSKYLPNLAIGFQDLGSAANSYGNKYIVMDKELWFIRASLGYGKADASNKNAQRMDGVFGGVEIKTFNWLYLLGENDSRENFAGVRIQMPQKWSSYFKLSSLLTSNITDNYRTSFSVNLTFPLRENTKSYNEKSIYTYKQKIDKINDKEKTASIVSDNIENLNPSIDVDEDLQNQIEKLGLENITIAVKNSTIYISYENGVFLFNDLDAMGVIIGLLTRTNYKNFIISQKRSKTTVVTISGNLNKAKTFYANPTPINKELFSQTLKKISPYNLSDYDIITKQANNSAFKPKIEFSPVIKTFVGTEFGVFNYMLWLRTKAIVNIYDGIDFSAVGDIHIYNSQIDDHQYDWYTRLFDNGSHIESIMLHANNNIYGGINTLSAGTFQENFAGIIDQYIYNIGNHTFKIKAGYFDQFQDGDTYKERYFGKIDKRGIYLAKYSYLLDNYDTLGEIKFGKYWNQDIGFDIKIKRFFGDVAVYMLYEQSKPYSSKNILSENIDHYAGLGIEIPLTLRHTPSYEYGQIRGTNAFDYHIQTTVLRNDGSNALVPGENYDPEVAISSENYFYNRNRLQLSYIKKHAFRLKQSYDEYVK